jgi:hypothetical protein
MSLRNHLNAEHRFQGEAKVSLADTVQLSFNVTWGGGILVAFPLLYPGPCSPSDVIFKELKVTVPFTFTFFSPSANQTMNSIHVTLTK